MLAMPKWQTVFRRCVKLEQFYTFLDIYITELYESQLDMSDRSTRPIDMGDFQGLAQ